MVEIDGKFAKFKLNKKSILNLTKDKLELIKTYVDKNDYSFSNEADVVLIFDYYCKL